MANPFEGLFESRRTTTFDGGEEVPKTYRDEFAETSAKLDADRVERARQRAENWKAKFDLYIASLPEDQRRHVQRLETAAILLRQVRPGQPPTANDLIKIAEYVEYGDTQLVASEAIAEQIARRLS